MPRCEIATSKKLCKEQAKFRVILTKLLTYSTIDTEEEYMCTFHFNRYCLEEHNLDYPEAMIHDGWAHGL